VYAQLKYLWASGEREHSIDRLRLFADELSRDLLSRQERHSAQATVTARMTELSQLLAKCYLKLGQWQYEIVQSWDHEVDLTPCGVLFVG
jgi:serine/threonine-protein kinase mTOR